MAYDYNRTSYTTYDKIFQKLVLEIDHWDGLDKDFGPVTRALNLCDLIQEVMDNDQDLLTEDKRNVKYGLEQQLGDLKEALHNAQKAARRLTDVYDEVNSVFLRNGLR